MFCHSDKAQGVSIRHAKYELEDADITNGFPIWGQQAFLPGEDAQDKSSKGNSGDCGKSGRVKSQVLLLLHRIQQKPSWFGCKGGNAI